MQLTAVTKFVQGSLALRPAATHYRLRPPLLSSLNHTLLLALPLSDNDFDMDRWIRPALDTRLPLLHCWRSSSLTHRLTVTASCPMDLQYFPLDRQLCSIEVESCESCLSLFPTRKLRQALQSKERASSHLLAVFATFACCSCLSLSRPDVNREAAFSFQPTHPFPLILSRLSFFPVSRFSVCHPCLSLSLSRDR